MSQQSEILDTYRRDLLGLFGDPSLVLVRGEGCEVTDANGRTYLDLLAGIAVNSLGHAHPRWAEAVAEQARTLGHVSNFFTSPQQVELATTLLEVTGAPEGSQVFFSNSGTEANEGALKLARRYGNTAEPRRRRIIALENGFHGRSAGALAVTWKQAYREPFEPLPGGVEFIEPTAEALAAAMDQEVAAVLLEPVQGEAGVRPLPEGMLRTARELTREHGALLLVDEVQSGMGRTGLWLESQRELGPEQAPDVVTLAKGLGGGFPIGAMLVMSEAARQALAPGSHGTTFGGNPLATAAGLATIRTIHDEHLLENARTVGERLRTGLAACAGVEEVRGRGLLVAADLAAVPGTEAPAQDFVVAAREAGFLVNATGPTTLRLCPPLVVTEDQVQSFLDAFPQILASVAS